MDNEIWLKLSILYMILNLEYKNDALFNGIKWGWTKESLEKGERGEWKIWLKTQHSENQDHGIWAHNFMPNR